MALVNTDLMSNDLNFYALVSGPVPSPFRNWRGRRSLLDVLLRRRRDSGLPLDMVPLSVVDLGVLHVPSGRLEACDPFVTLGRDIVFAVEPGDYPVKATVADISKEHDGSHERNAYLSLVLADGEAAAVAMSALADGANLYDEFEPEPWCGPLDSPDHYREGMANIVMPLDGAGENIIMALSGWGDGVYPVMLTRDADGAPLGLHIDLGVVGEFADDDEDEQDGAGVESTNADGAGDADGAGAESTDVEESARRGLA